MAAITEAGEVRKGQGEDRDGVRCGILGPPQDCPAWLRDWLGLPGLLDRDGRARTAWQHCPICLQLWQNT